MLALAPLLLVSNKISYFTALHNDLPGPATNRYHDRRKEWQDTWPARHLSLGAVLTMYKTRGRKERYSRKKRAAKALMDCHPGPRQSWGESKKQYCQCLANTAKGSNEAGAEAVQASETPSHAGTSPA